MHKLVVPEQTIWDEKDERFIQIPSYELELEHSLLAISKWESKWNKPFLTDDPKSDEEFRDYIRCMSLDEEIPYEAYAYLNVNQLHEINKYIESPMTATTIHDSSNNSPKREIITAELVYYWMISLRIPFECERWHFNRLMTLIRVCGIKNSPDKKMSDDEVMARQKRINAARRKNKKK